MGLVAGGEQGGVGLSLRFGSTSLAFVTAHFAAHPHKIKVWRARAGERPGARAGERPPSTEQLEFGQSKTELFCFVLVCSGLFCAGLLCSVKFCRVLFWSILF